MDVDACVIGAGLAGSEAAWQLARRGHRVLLCEMRPGDTTPAHATGMAAEMVCSNSFKSDDPLSATGILKAEMEALGSVVLAAARETRVPAGLSLAVDRTAFAGLVTERLQGHVNIEWKTGLVAEPPEGIPTIIASGPLTAGPLARWISEAFSEDALYFYDAIAPIVERGSIDLSIAFPASRYGKGAPDFINCPLDKDQYECLVDAILAAPLAPTRDFDVCPKYFEACLPIEVMAGRGRDTLRFGPMKPVGLADPRTGRWPHAAVQLRQDTAAGDLYNLVGFQTRIAWGAQPGVFRLIPGLEGAVFQRYGSIHRNTYICAPRLLDATLAAKGRPGVFFAGQLAGVEGYLESAASGLAAAMSVDDFLRGLMPREFPRGTMIGSLLHYLASAEPEGFAPVNAMMGLLPAVGEGAAPAKIPKAARRQMQRDAALGAMAEFAAGWLATSG
jgi:methylenetetrahydrofolate--tRNA-(uracil-5-)-methyltransferase